MNICAVRSFKVFNETLRMEWLPHESVTLTEDERQRRHIPVVHYLELRVMPVGTPIKQDGRLWCKHCGSLYAEDEP